MYTGCGLKNLGNSCYLNATIQALLHIPYFVNWLLSIENLHSKCRQSNLCINLKDNRNTTNWCFICALFSTFKYMENHTNNCGILRDISPNFVFGQQEDGHECYLGLINQISLINSKCSNFDNIASNQRNPMTDIFGGVVQIYIKCSLCNFEKKSNCCW